MESKEKLVASSCDIHAAAVEAIAQGCEGVNQLRDLLLPVADNLSELAGGLFEETLRSFSMALSMLQGSRRLQSSCSPAASLVTSPCSGEPENKSLDKTRENPEVGDHKNTSRKRWYFVENKSSMHPSFVQRTQHSRPTETCIPHYDGHQWRKYGQKDIRGSKYPRTYYKCTFRENQGCQARKTVQQKDDGNPPKYIVTYDGQHSCKPMEDNSPIVVIDSTPTRASTLNSMGSLEEQSLSPMAAQDQNNNGTFSWETADFVTTIPTAGTPELCEAMWNPFSPPSLFDGCLESLNYEVSWIP